MTSVARRVAPGVPFGEGLKLSAEMLAAIPPGEIGRIMSGVEAAELIFRLVENRGKAKAMTTACLTTREPAKWPLVECASRSRRRRWPWPPATSSHEAGA
jgi:hypothetical protein